MPVIDGVNKHDSEVERIPESELVSEISVKNRRSSNTYQSVWNQARIQGKVIFTSVLPFLPIELHQRRSYKHLFIPEENTGTN